MDMKNVVRNRKNVVMMVNNGEYWLYKGILNDIASGNQTFHLTNPRQMSRVMGTSSISGGFSTVMFDYQRVSH